MHVMYVQQYHGCVLNGNTVPLFNHKMYSISVYKCFHSWDVSNMYIGGFGNRKLFVDR